MSAKFGAPKIGENTCDEKMRKLAQRVEQTLSDETLLPEPKQLDPQTILVAPLNRQGAPHPMPPSS